MWPPQRVGTVRSPIRNNDMTIRLPSSVSFWRGNIEGDDISVFDVLQVMDCGQCDRMVLEYMVDDGLDICDEDDLEEMPDHELFTRLVCECATEREWKARFRKAFKRMCDDLE